MNRIHHLLASWLFALSGLAYGAADLRTPHVELHLETGRDSVVAGETLWLGLRFELIPHWHIYWRNPGDSGEPPKVDWRLPVGWQAGEIHWPVPRRIPLGPLLNYGYEGGVTLLVPVRTAAGMPAGDSARIDAEVSWLVCREECIPQSGSLSIELPVTPPATRDLSPTPDRFAQVRGQWPLPFTGQADYAPAADGTLRLRLNGTGWSADRIAELWFAADDWGPVAASGEQRWRADGDALLLSIPPGEAPPAPGSTLHGLLVVTEATADGPLTRGFTIAAEDAALGGGARSGLTLLLALGLATLGGLLLNLMPCVLPVLSIKVLGLVRHAGGASARHGLMFMAGVLVTFTTLAGLLLGLRHGGEALGWGFQLQEPLVVILLMYLMLAVALNLSGVYAIGAGVAGVGQGATTRPGLAGTFGTGVLAVVVASPCTAPFMGTALGFALTRPAFEALLVFVALGIGFGLPVLLLSLWPRWLKHLPPPGAWMERLRNGLAFPMYGAAAWLLWVLSQQVAAPTLAAVLAGAVLLAFALWWHGQALRNRRRQWLVVAGAILGSVGLAALAAVGPPGPGDGAGAGHWSSERVRELRAQGRPVLVNFTAAWCITCKVNEQIALDTDAVRKALEHNRIAYLKGDWTRRDAAITAELQRHGRSGVPLYLLFPAGDGEPLRLPQLLSEGLVLQAIQDTQRKE